MADNFKPHHQQRFPQLRSSLTGWVLGIIVAVLAILAFWYYGMQHKLISPPTSSVTTEQPATPPPPAPAPDSSSGSTTTAPAPAPAAP